MDGTVWKAVMNSLQEGRTFVTISVNAKTQAIEVDSNVPDTTLLMGLLQQAQWVVMEEHRLPMHRLSMRNERADG